MLIARGGGGGGGGGGEFFFLGGGGVFRLLQNQNTCSSILFGLYHFSKIYYLPLEKQNGLIGLSL